MTNQTPMRAIKGFDTDLKCRDYQFAIGETYTHDGVVQPCKSGFHAIKDDAHPLAVFDYYAPSGSRFCIVELSGDIKSDDGTKVAAQILKIQKEIGLKELCEEAVAWVTARATEKGEHTKGDQGAASATGDQGAASATGTRGAASATGYQGAASATGDQGAASATGDQGAASATGYQGAASATGYQGAASATGTRGAASATGDQGAAMTSGHEGRVKGVDGNALFACERDTWDGPIISVACGIVGQKKIKADTWYVCKSGKLVAA